MRLLARTLHTQVGLFAAVEVGVHLGHAGDGGQHRLLAHQVACGDVGARDAAGDRRAHGGELQVQPRHAQPGFGGLDIGFTGARAARQLVEFLARHGLGVQQLLCAGQLAAGQFGARLHGGQL
jgi:hypothetical protein